MSIENPVYDDDVNPSLLFAYGTLLVAGNPFAEWLKANSTPAGRGTINGILYNLGEYPGAVYDGQSQSRIHGTILRLNNPAESFKQLDEYEGTEYIRKTVPVQMEESVCVCWIYLYCFQTEHLTRIESGDYLNP